MAKDEEVESIVEFIIILTTITVPDRLNKPLDTNKFEELKKIISLTNLKNSDI